MRVIGTAGHVDHGKSTLVLSLTGMDPDRLKEEKAREMTIDLGFAWLDVSMPGGQVERVGIIDVPGHIDFIKNMLAGVGGIDIALLVVAADEGVMPQTREHVAILDLLQVSGGVVALTKADLVEDEEWLALVEDEVHDLLRHTSLADAPVVPVTARKRRGLEQLLAVLSQQLAQLPARSNRGQPRLPVDRSFSMAGFGTVVTGTLIDGALRVGDEVEIMPAGLTARVRGLQSHNEKIEEALPGTRVAINLSGVRPADVARGQWVTLPGALHNSMLVDVRLRALPGTTPLKHNQRVEFFCGAAEVPAHLRLLDSERLEPGSEGWVQLRLAKPLPLLRGDRFIVRQPSPSHTLGGGLVVDPQPARRWRRFRPDVLSRLETLSTGTPGEIWLQALQRDEPATVRQVNDRSALKDALAIEALAEVTASGDLVRLLPGSEPGPEAMVVSQAGWSRLGRQLVTILADYHRSNPLRGGMPRGELKSRLDQSRRAPLTARAFNELLRYAETERLLRTSEATVREAGHHVTLTPAQQMRVSRQLAAFRAQPYTPPAIADVRSQLGDELLSALFEQGQLVKLNEDVVFDAATYAELVTEIRGLIRQEGSVTVAQVRDRFGTSRKYALAILEYLDAVRVTRRVGDARVLR